MISRVIFIVFGKLWMKNVRVRTVHRVSEIKIMHGRTKAIFAILVCLATAGCQMSSPSDAARIHAQKSSTLVVWLNGKLPNDLAGADPMFSAEICEELVARHQVNFLLSQLNATNSPDAREWLVSHVLFCINDRRIYNTFVHRLSDKEDRENYYIALYLAQRGNMQALATLNRHYFQYPVASFEWEVAVAAFGKFTYMPAVTNVYGDLNAANLGLAGTAYGALQEMFPGSPTNLGSPLAAEVYFGKRLDQLTNTQAISGPN
jgi:hypothetical protein